MRASSLVLGPLVARAGFARVSMPGGCAIGARPIDLHLKGLEKLGAQIIQEHGYIEARAKKLKGARYSFDRITVTGTEDVLMAAVLAEGETVLENCAREPEVVDLAALLVKMGAKIEGAGTSTIKIKGVAKLKGARHRIIPDRIEAATFLLAGALTGGDLMLQGCEPTHPVSYTHLDVYKRQAQYGPPREFRKRKAGTQGRAGLGCSVSLPSGLARAEAARVLRPRGAIHESFQPAYAGQHGL